MKYDFTLCDRKDIKEFIEKNHYSNALAKLEEQIALASDEEKPYLEEKKAELEAWLRQNPVKTQAQIEQEAQKYILNRPLKK